MSDLAVQANVPVQPAAAPTQREASGECHSGPKGEAFCGPDSFMSTHMAQRRQEAKADLVRDLATLGGLLAIPAATFGGIKLIGTVNSVPAKPLIIAGEQAIKGASVGTLKVLGVTALAAGAVAGICYAVYKLQPEQK